MFRASGTPEPFVAAGDLPVYLMAWTTTPWTLPANLGLTVGPNIDYVLVETFNPYTADRVAVVLAEALLSKYFKPEGENGDFDSHTKESKLLPWRILARFKGRELDGLRYEQLIPHEANTAEKSGGDPFRVITGDFVTTEDGTGIVHTAPAFGADDYKVGKQNNLGLLNLVDRQGRFVEGLGELSGRYIKDYTNAADYKEVDVDIAVALKTSGHAFKVEKYEHTYPHCWRTDKPVIYYPLDAWFIRTTAAKERMVALNKTIQWKPAATGEGRFGNWLENMVDWNLSRSRYWGTPLPVWVTADTDTPETKCIGSVAELIAEMQAADGALGLDQTATLTGTATPTAEQLKALLDDTAQTGFDLHKPFVDKIELVDSQGRRMRREPDLIDVWFDSGAMPYAQWHYPFENKEKIDAGEAFPADFIAEGVDQTRGWFYTLHALGVLLFDSVAYKTVVSNGLVLDKNGQKMSKRLGNVVDPFKTIDQFGADATRWYLVTASSPWDNLKFDLDGIGEVQRKFFGTLFNTYQFFVLYANVDGFSGTESAIPYADRPEADRWILSALHTLVQQVTDAYDAYEPTTAGRLIEDFLDENLSNWYVRLNRRRFWKGEYNDDKISAFQTLFECLKTISQLIAPVAPFFADWLWRNLRGENDAMSESVHLSDFPEADPGLIDTELEARTHIAQDLSSLLLSIRKKVGIKVRQPLQKALIPVLDATMRAQIEAVAELVRSEVNVKEFEYLEGDNSLIQKKLKPNFKTLGGRLGANMKTAAALLTALPTAEINKLEAEGRYELLLPDGTTATIVPEDVAILAEDVPGWSIASKGTLTAALDITLTPELLAEGTARELVNRVQKLRKDMGLSLTDRIVLEIGESEVLTDALSRYPDYIKAEVLADVLRVGSVPAQSTDIDVADATVKVFISKSSA
jgi:isoleucyl-tRNA synthetase